MVTLNGSGAEATVRDLIDRMADTQQDRAFLVSPETGAR